MSSEIAVGDRGSEGCEPGRVRVAERTAVQRGGAVRGDRLQRGGERGLTDDVADGRRRAARVVDGSETGILGVGPVWFGECHPERVADGDAVAR